MALLGLLCGRAERLRSTYLTLRSKMKYMKISIFNFYRFLVSKLNIDFLSRVNN